MNWSSSADESAAYCISEVCIGLLTWQHIYQLIDSFSIVLRFNEDIDAFCQLVPYQNRHVDCTHQVETGRCTAVPSNIIILCVGLPVPDKTLASCWFCFMIFHVYLNSCSRVL